MTVLILTPIACSVAVGAAALLGVHWVGPMLALPAVIGCCWALAL